MTLHFNIVKKFRSAMKRLRIAVDDERSYTALFEIFALGVEEGAVSASKTTLPLTAEEEKVISGAIEEIRAEVDDDEVMH